MALQPIKITASLEGADQLVRSLNVLERKVLPRAEANALNRTGTRARKNGISRIAKAEHRKRKSFRGIVRVAKRARAFKSPFVVVAVYRRQDVRPHGVRLSKPFRADGRRGIGIYRRRIPGAAWTTGRPRTSPPNLPIYPEMDPVRDRRNAIVQEECRQAMRNYYPGELRAQLDRLVTKLITRRRGRRR